MRSGSLQIAQVFDDEEEEEEGAMVLRAPWVQEEEGEDLDGSLGEDRRIRKAFRQGRLSSFLLDHDDRQ
jgi:hypothetical protein